MAEEEVKEAENGGNEGEEEVTEDEASAKGGKKKLLLIFIPIILLVVGCGLYFTGIIGGSSDDTQVEGEVAEGEEGGEVADNADANAAFYELPPFIVNLSSDQGARFLKMRVQLEIANEADLAALESVTPRVIDPFQTYLREMRVEDLRGSAGIYRLRQELLYRVNSAAHPVEVTDVLFQEMLIQ